MDVYVAHVLGSPGDYDEILAESLEVAKAAAEAEYPDYYGKPIQWKESPLTRSHGGVQLTGTFHESAHVTLSIVIVPRKVWSAQDVAERKIL